MTEANPSQPEKGGRGWSINAGQFDPELHLPSEAQTSLITESQTNYPEEVKDRIAATRIIFVIVLLINPEIVASGEATAKVGKQIREATEQASHISDKQYESLKEYIAQETGKIKENRTEEPAILQAITVLKERGAIDEKLYDLAAKSIAVLRTNELDATPWAETPK